MRFVQKLSAGFFLTSLSIFANPGFADDKLGLSGNVGAPEYAVSPPRDFADAKLATSATIGRQPVAVNPKNPNVFVAAFTAQGACWVRTSTNGGQTWAAARKLPMPEGKKNCDTPAVTWTPDGSGIYAAYSYLLGDPFDSQEAGAIVSSSNDKGLTWSSPKIALHYPYEYFRIISLQLSTPLRPSDPKWVYLLSDLRHYDSGHAEFTRSADGGRTWSSGQRLTGYDDTSGNVNCPSVAGGLGGEVLVAWGEDLYDWDGNLLFKNVFFRRSADYGNSFSADMVAVPDTTGDTAVAFGSGGTAHLVYLDGYNGKPSYVYSTKAPYTAWSKPVALSDDTSASGYYSPALSVSACGSNTSVLHAIWMDDRLGTDKLNLFYTRKVAKTGEMWSPNLRISGTVMSPDYWLGAGIAAGVGSAVSVWGQQNRYASPVPVRSSRIAPGVSCP